MTVTATGWSKEALSQWRESIAPWHKNFWNIVYDESNTIVGGVIFVGMILLCLILSFTVVPSAINYCFPIVIIAVLITRLADSFKKKEPSWATLSPVEFSKAVGGAMAESTIRTVISEQLILNPEAGFEVEYLDLPLKEKFPSSREKNFILWVYPKWFEWSHKQAVLVVQNGRPTTPSATQ